MHEPEREQLLSRVFEARDRLEVLIVKTSDPELAHRIREADADAAALEAECHLSLEVTAGLADRIAAQTEVVDKLVAEVGRAEVR